MKICLAILLIFLLVLPAVYISTSSIQIFSLDTHELQNEPFFGSATAPLPFNSHDEFQVFSTDSVMSKRPQDWDMSPIVVEEYKLLFFTTPKVACTLFKQLFRRMKGMKDWKSQDIKKNLPHNPKANGLVYLNKFNTSFAREIFLDPSWTKAIFIREPKKRFLSAYLDKAVSNNALFIRDKCCARSLVERKNCRKKETCRQCVHNGSQDLKGFLNLIHKCKDPHWDLQSNRMEPKYWRFINFIGKMENITHDAERLLRQVGAWDKYGRSGWGPDSNTGMVDRGSASHINHATNSESKTKFYYTPEVERQVEQFYWDDLNNPLFRFKWENFSALS